MTVQCHHYNQPNHMHENLSTGGNSSSPSHTPLFEHTLTHTTIGRANTNTSTRLCCSSHETTTTPTWICATDTPHHKARKQSPSSNDSHGQIHGQAPQLQAINEQPKIQRKHGACQQPTNSGDWQMASEGTSKTPPTLSSSSPNTRCQQIAGKRHVRAVCMLGQTRKGRTQPNAIHARG